MKVGGWYEHANSWRHTWDFSWTTGLPSYDQKFAAHDRQATRILDRAGQHQV
jgi:hypothetical protein